MKVKKNSEEHRKGLTQMYTSLCNEAVCNKNRFQSVLFDSALLKLQNGIKPTKVENWVVKMEKLWTKFL